MEMIFLENMLFLISILEIFWQIIGDGKNNLSEVSTKTPWTDLPFVTSTKQIQGKNMLEYYHNLPCMIPISYYTVKKYIRGCNCWN